MDGLCTVIGRTVGGDVLALLHTVADKRFVHSNWENCWYGCVYCTAYTG